MALVASAQLGSRANQQASNTISQVHQCPTFDVGHQQDILIADGSERELSIRVKNMPQFKVSDQRILRSPSMVRPRAEQIARCN